MWKASASAVCGCRAALLLIGCAGDVTAPGRAAAVTPSVIANIAPSYAAGPRTYAVGPAQPAAILVVLPDTGAENDADLLFRDPALWAAQGFEVVMPRPADVYRLIADHQAAMVRFVAATRALANAPIWLVGPGPAIDAVLATAPQLARGVAGAVVTWSPRMPAPAAKACFTPTPATERLRRSRLQDRAIAGRLQLHLR